MAYFSLCSYVLFPNNFYQYPLSSPPIELPIGDPMVEFLREDRKILFQNHIINYEVNVAQIYDRNKVFLLGLLAVAAFCISYYSPVSYAHADPAGTLLTTQSDRKSVV
jgi:hypothetical protein